MARIDVTVRGAGIFGLSVAFACLRRGARVRVIDPGGVGAGASGGIVGALAPHVPESWNEKKAFQFESLVMAEDFWARVADISGEDPGYARTGRVQPLLDARAVELAQARAAGAQQHWGAQFDWRVTHDPGAIKTVSPTGYFVHDTLSARLHPRRATQALGCAVRALGGDVLAQGETEGAEVWATGVHDLEALSEAAGRTMGNGVKGQAALLQFAAPDATQLFVDGVHFIPHGDGSLAIGSTSEREYTNASQTDGLLDDVLTKARALCPAIAQAEVLERWAGVRPRARSRAPILGAHPVRTGAFIANGGFKIGFGMAPKVGDVMADLVLEGRDCVPESFKALPLPKGAR